MAESPSVIISVQSLFFKLLASVNFFKNNYDVLVGLIFVFNI